eukprot:911939-Rhodomonas_salina.1
MGSVGARADLVVGAISITRERLDKLDFSFPYYSLQQVTLAYFSVTVKRASGFDLDLQGYLNIFQPFSGMPRGHVSGRFRSGCVLGHTVTVWVRFEARGHAGQAVAGDLPGDPVRVGGDYGGGGRRQRAGAPRNQTQSGTLPVHFVPGV